MSGQGRLLVVGDDRLGAALGDYETTAAPDATAAIDALSAGSIDCLVTAHDLPGSDGIDLLDTVRERWPALPVVLAVVDGDEALASTAIARGVTEYVPAVADEALLVEAVERALATTPKERAVDGVTEGDALMDPVVKTRAMDEAPIGITISDPDLPDNPMVYINRAFADLTGYPVRESLGRNCRFLQGEGTSEEPVAKMRESVAAADPVSVELRNYRADGTEFWNRVDIAPLRDEDGELTHFVGFQTDITERVEAERAAEQRAAELAAERERMTHLVDRIEDLLESTTDVLVRSTTQSAVESGVCDVVAGTDPYVGAWIGSYEMGDDALTLAASSGVDFGDSVRGGPHPAAVSRADGDRFPLDDADATARAVETHEVQVVGDIEAEAVAPWHRRATTGAATALVAVPLVVHDRCFGVLHCYVTDDSVLDDQELTVLGALGRMTATALDAMAARRVITADSVVEMRFEVVDEGLFVAACSAELDCNLAYAGSVHRPDGRLRTFFRVAGAAATDVVAFAAGRPDVESVSAVTETEDDGLVAVTFAERSLVELLADHDAETTAIEAEDGVATVTVTVPASANPRSLAELLTDAFAGVELVRYREREREPTTRSDFVGQVDERLTDRQRSALELAHLSGYFERPRPVSGDELAASMDVSRATFHQHLRVAQRKLVDAYLAG